MEPPSGVAACRDSETPPPSAPAPGEEAPSLSPAAPLVPPSPPAGLGDNVLGDSFLLPDWAAALAEDHAAGPAADIPQDAGPPVPAAATNTTEPRRRKRKAEPESGAPGTSCCRLVKRTKGVRDGNLPGIGGRPYLLLEHPTTRQLAEKKLAEWDKRLRGRNSLLRRHWEGIEWARPIKVPPLGWELEDKAEAEASVQSGEMIDPRGLRARWPAWRDFDGRAVTDKAPEGPSPAPPPPQPPQPQQPQQQQQQQGPAHRTPGGAWRGGGSGPQAGRGKGRGRIPPLLPRGANDVVWGAPAPR